MIPKSGCLCVQYLMGVFGVVDAAASSILGKLSDRFGRFPLLVLGSVVHLTGYILLIAASPLNQLTVLIPVACVFGIGDAAFNTQIYGILGYMFPDSSEASFASYKFYRAASTGILFFRKNNRLVLLKCCRLIEC